MSHEGYCGEVASNAGVRELQYRYILAHSLSTSQSMHLLAPYIIQPYQYWIATRTW